MNYFQEAREAHKPHLHSRSTAKDAPKLVIGRINIESITFAARVNTAKRFALFLHYKQLLSVYTKRAYQPINSIAITQYDENLWTASITKIQIWKCND